jgi:hypothetical protein
MIDMKHPPQIKGGGGQSSTSPLGARATKSQAIDKPVASKSSAR